MQLRQRLSKILMIVALSGSFFVAWNNGNHIEVINFHVTTSDESANENIWGSISENFTLDRNIKSSRVQAEIRKLVADQERLHQILEAAAPYIYFIYKQIQTYGLPAEIALIPFVESEFNPNDRSKKGALGLWQLMPRTASELGVKVKSGYDGRRNIAASTKAALLYFRDLGVMFNGNWHLAIAAYNCGQMKVKSAQKRVNSQQYENLPLPLETKYYVPRLLAVAEIIKNPGKYGVELPKITNEPYFTELKTEKSGDLQHVANSSGVDIKTLEKLNPDYKRGVVTKNTTLLVPIKKETPVQTTAAEETPVKKETAAKKTATKTVH